MAYSRPKSYGYTQTPAPGGAVPAGDELVAWTDLDLTVANFHAMARAGAPTLADYDFTNPNPGELKIEHLTTSIQKWEGTNLQDGPVLIWPTQIPPRTFANPPGVSGNQWRNEDAILTVDMRVKSIGRTGGGDPLTLGVGPMMIFLQTDEGSGAVFIANNPAPPYHKAVAPGVDTSYFHAKFGFQNAATTNWDWASTSNQNIKVQGGLAGPIAAAGVGDSMQISTVPCYQNFSVGGQAGGSVVASCYDSRVTDGGVYFDGVANTPVWGNNFRSEVRYVYIGLAVSNWASGANAAGAFYVIDRLRYTIQPVRNRSL